MSGTARVGVGAVVRRGDTVLLVRRARAPCAGEWAIPGGKVRWGEPMRVAAEREILEETGIRIRAGRPIYTFEHIEHDATGEVLFHYVIVDFAGEYLGGEPRAGDDAADARWVALAELDHLPVNRSTRRALAEIYPDEVPPP